MVTYIFLFFWVISTIYLGTNNGKEKLLDPRSMFRSGPVITIFFGALLAILPAGLYFIFIEPPTSTELTENQKNQYYILEQQAKIKSILKDSNSAEFKNAYVSKSLGVPVVCGQVNSKNSFGGFNGMQRFVSGGTIQVIEEQIGQVEMNNVWLKTCTPAM